MVITDVNQVVYQGDGVNTAWPFTFAISDASEIRVQLNNADGTAVLIDSDFYVDTVTSTVYYPGYAPGAEPAEADQPPKVQTGQTITVYREVPMTQEADLGDKWPFQVIEGGLDKLTMICQQIYGYTNRKLDAALASMFQLAGIVTDSGKLQHITDQYNAIDANAAAAAESEENAAASATAAANSATASANSANNSAGSAASASTTATQLMEYLATKEEITAPAVDPTLTISGAAADAMAVGDVFNDIDYRSSNLDPGYINYNYGSGEERLERDPSATNSTAFGVKRSGTVIELTGGGITSVAYLKLTNEVVRTITDATIRSWNTGISLEEGKVYYAEVIPINSEAESLISSVAITVYAVGTSMTIGTGSLENGRYYRLFSAPASAINIVFYVRANTTFENAKFRVVLHQMGVAKPLEEYLDKKINEQNDLINYGYPVAKDFLTPIPNATNGGVFGIYRMGTHYTLTGGGIRQFGYLRITNSMTRVDNSNSVKNWTTGIALQEGKKYKVILRAINDTAKAIFNENPTLSCSVYLLGTSNTIGSRKRDSYNYIDERTFVATSDLINIAIYCPSYINFGDDGADFDISLQDVTFEDESDAIAPYYIDELNNTINKINNLKDEPCLTFMWATDIHKDSSNASGVQTFDKMIQNMKSLVKSVHCDFILNTGDDTDGNVAKATTLQRAYDMTKEFMSIGVPYIKSNGNHDNNPYNGELNYFNITDVYKAYYTLTPHTVTINTAENGTDFYIDYNDIGVRLISVNDNNIKTRYTYSWGSTTPNWLISALETDKTVLLALHISPIPTQVYNNQSVYTSDLNSSVLNALNNFVNSGGNLIMLSGHSHADMAFISPFLSVMSVCQRYYVDETSVDDSEGFQVVSGYIDVINRPERTAGTYTEDAWTVGVYKPFSNELDLIRFGAGNDRYFHITPIAPTTVTSRLSGTLTWSSSDETVATVADGVITGIGTGKCAILAKDAEGNYECWIVRC